MTETDTSRVERPCPNCGVTLNGWYGLRHCGHYIAHAHADCIKNLRRRAEKAERQRDYNSEVIEQRNVMLTRAEAERDTARNDAPATPTVPLQEQLHKTRETFRIAMPGSNEEFTAWMQGFDTAAEIALKTLARPEPDAVREDRTITDPQEARDRLLSGDVICYSQDGDCAWFNKGDSASVSDAVVWYLRNAGHLLRKDDGYRSCWDEASPALRDLAEGDSHDRT